MFFSLVQKCLAHLMSRVSFWSMYPSFTGYHSWFIPALQPRSSLTQLSFFIHSSLSLPFLASITPEAQVRALTQHRWGGSCQLTPCNSWSTQSPAVAAIHLSSPWVTLQANNLIRVNTLKLPYPLHHTLSHIFLSLAFCMLNLQFLHGQWDRFIPLALQSPHRVSGTLWKSHFPT